MRVCMKGVHVQGDVGEGCVGRMCKECVQGDVGEDV